MGPRVAPLRPSDQNSIAVARATVPGWRVDSPVAEVLMALLRSMGMFGAAPGRSCFPDFFYNDYDFWRLRDCAYK